MANFSELAFTPREYDRRLEAARKAAAQLDVGALLLFDPSVICYLSGFSTINLWDTVCLIIPANAEPITVFREFESERFAVSSRFSARFPFPAGGDCTSGVVETLRKFELAASSVGVEMSRYLPARTLAGLRTAFPETSIRECQGPLNEVRLTKSPMEIEMLRKAAAITDAGILAGREAAREGASDHEVCAETTRAMLAGGSDFMCIQPVVAVGARTGIAHSSTAGCTVHRGDPVFLEIGACVHRYTAPLMRTLLPAAASDELRELSELSSKTLDAMIAAMRPGARAGDVAAAGEKVLGPALSRIAFHFVWGYSVGLGFPPSWLEETGFILEKENHRELQPGMVFHLPMMLRLRGVAGAGSSETVLVTESGAEILSTLPRQITI